MIVFFSTVYTQRNNTSDIPIHLSEIEKTVIWEQ